MRTLRCAPPGEPAATVHLGRGALDALPAAVESALGRPWTGGFALVDAAVRAAHADRLPAELTGLPGLDLDGGEDAKTLAQLERVLRALAAAGIERGGMLVVVGGGSLGDLGGLAAALYLRGIDVVQVPTTLLAMVDSSVGGKTAVNLPEGKNLVGAFWPARLTVIDPELTTTLDDTAYRSGLAELVKAAIGLDAALFARLEQDAGRILVRDLEALEPVLAAAVQAKIDVVERDPREAGPRRLLNLGHTLGHALEAASGFELPHGLAVARGIHFAIDVACAEGLADAAALAPCRTLLERLGYAAGPLPPTAELLRWLARDKKIVAGDVRMALPTAPGHSVEHAVPLPRLRALLDRVTG